jgi:hypothetical protein
MSKISGQRSQSIVLTFGIAIFDRQILALDVAGLLQTLKDRRDAPCVARR